MVFKIWEASGSKVPVIVSVPHRGFAFPDELKDQYKPSLRKSPDDTDWFVDKLYDFAPSMGITMISANYSRWVIDLNRDPHSKPLYTDGRLITGLCPATDFLGQPIYKDERAEVELPEVKRRVELYYKPYHQQIEKLLAEMNELIIKFNPDIVIEVLEETASHLESLEVMERFNRYLIGPDGLELSPVLFASRGHRDWLLEYRPSEKL